MPTAVAFTNGSRVRIEGREAVNLSTGLRALLLEPVGPELEGQRCAIQDVAGVDQETIDLATNGVPSLRASFRNYAIGPAERVAMLAPKLPTDLSAPSRVARRKLFKGFDGNGNGFLSLAEVDRGVRDVLGSDELFDAKAVIMRAFQAAKAAGRSRSPHGEDYVEDGVEFRLLLVYLKRYFEMHAMFREIDSSGDQRLDEGEVKAALPLLRGWGMDVGDDAAAVFGQMDVDSGGKVRREGCMRDRHVAAVCDRQV